MTTPSPVRVIAVWLSGLLWTASPAIGSAEREVPPPGDLEVKAGFVLNFVRLVNWSDFPGEPNRAGLLICALSRSEFFAAVASATTDKTAGRRSIRVEINPNPDPRLCRVLIADAGDYASARQVLKSMMDAPVLTIGNGTGFLDIGGMFELVVENRRVRFDAGLQAIRRSGLDVSARLLQLARNLRGGTGAF